MSHIIKYFVVLFGVRRKLISYKVMRFFTTKCVFIFTVRPLSIKLVGDNRPISASIPVNVSCRVTGAKPPPIVTWWKDAVQMTDAKQTVSNLLKYTIFF